MAYKRSQPELKAIGDCPNCPDFWDCVNGKSDDNETTEDVYSGFPNEN
ncbi:MAG: hypothetical protein LBC53_06890 [Spirochaetaceae bacterium]|jgi:hypothetical protein|nr:hypothetical protein [Spirochaetaceae bacterium]